MQVSALSYAERIPEWTPTITTDTDAAGGYDIYTYQDLELAYPGHWGKGFWVVTGDYRVTDLANLGYASFFLYNSATQLTHGVCGGYVYDTNWKQFSIIAGWQSDFPSTMKLHLELAVSTGAASNIVRVRNVRLAFIQLADRDGIPLVGRDSNSAGYHVQTMKWDYSPFDAVELEPLDPFGSTNHVANLAVMTNSGMANNKTYMTMHHINGVNCYGYEAHTNADKMDVVLDAGNEYAARMRPLPGYYPSYGFITHKTGGWSTSNGVRQPYNSFLQVTNASFETENLDEPPYVQFNPVANVSIDYYGGWFMMTLEKDASDEIVFVANTTWGSGSANTSANLVSNTAGVASLQRSLFFGVGHTSSYGTSRADLSVTIDGKVIHSANVTDLGSANGGFATPYSYFGFANEVVDGNKRTLRETITRNGSGGSIGYGPRQGLLIPVSRAYVNSTYKIANTAANQGTGSQTWANVANLYTANTSAYAQMANVSPTAANNRYLRVTNFKFDEHIPADATIGYVWMSPVCRRAGANGAITWNDVKMVANGAAVGASVAWSSPWANTWSYVGPDVNLGASTYWTLDNTVAEGGSSTRDGLWNYRPTAAQVRANTFGFQMRCVAAANTSPTAQIAYVTAVVYYRLPGETFNRVVTSTAGSLTMTPDREHDVTSVSVLTQGKTLTPIKSIGRRDSTPPIDIEDPTFIKGFGQNRLSVITNLPKKLASSLGSFKTLVKPLTPISVKAIVGATRSTANVVSSAASLPREIGKAVRRTLGSYPDNRHYIVGDTRTTTANTSVTSRKGMGKVRSFSVSHIVSKARSVGKTTARPIVTVVRKAAAIGRTFPVISTISATLTKVKNTAYYISAAIVAPMVATSRKAVTALPRSAGVVSATADFLGFIRGKSISGFATMTATAASLPRTIGKGKAVIAPMLVRKAAAIGRVDVVLVPVSVASRKAVAGVRSASASMAAVLAKGIGRVRTRSVAAALTARKAVSQATDAVAVATSAVSRKAVQTRDSLAGSISVSGRKGLGKAVKRTLGTIAKTQKAIASTRVKTISSIATVRRAVASFSVAAVSSLASASKAINRRAVNVVVASTARGYQTLGTLVRKLYFIFTEVGHLVSNGGFTFKFGDTSTGVVSQVYSDHQTLRLSGPTVIEATLGTEAETITASLAAPQVFTVTLSDEDSFIVTQ